MRGSRHVAGVLVLAGMAAASLAWAAETGQVVDDVKLASLDGKPERLVDGAASATVVVFFRPEHDRSVDALRAIAECEPSLGGKRTRLVGVVSDQAPVAEVRATLELARSRLPVLLDAGDALYARLGVRMHPALAILDGSRRVVAIDPFHALGACDVLRARVRRVQGEITDADVEKALAPKDSQLPGEDPAQVARRHVKFGRKLLAARAFAEAHEKARKSIELAPSAAAWALEGEIFAAEGRCGDANGAFEAALKLDGTDAAALAGRAACAR